MIITVSQLDNMEPRSLNSQHKVCYKTSSILLRPFWLHEKDLSIQIDSFLQDLL